MALEVGSHPKPTQIADALVTDGLAVEGEGVLVQVRQVVRLWSSEATRFWCGYFLGFRSVFHKTSKPHPTT